VASVKLSQSVEMTWFARSDTDDSSCQLKELIRNIFGLLQFFCNFHCFWVI